MSIFEDGARMLDSAFGFAAVRISYARSGRSSHSMPAKLGRTVFRYEDASGAVIRTEQRDFIVPATFFCNRPPEVGDSIWFDGKYYIVSAPNDEPCWRWHSRQNHSEIRIHAKYLSDQRPVHEQ